MSRRVLAVVVWLFLCAPGYSQTLGTITGEVKDESGATVPGATVTAQNVATNAVRTQVSNQAGNYTCANYRSVRSSASELAGSW